MFFVMDSVVEVRAPILSKRGLPQYRAQVVAIVQGSLRVPDIDHLAQDELLLQNVSFHLNSMPPRSK